MDKKSFLDVFAKDLIAHHPPVQKYNIFVAIKYPILRYQRRLRIIEFLSKNENNKNFIKYIYFNILKYFHQRDSIRLGFTIPPHTCGPGLSIAHWGTICIEGKARVGANCRIHQGVTIGSSGGKVPVIGDNCFIGCGSAIIGGIILGDNVTIGANALVNRSFPSGAVLVGVPAVNISNKVRVDEGRST
ncbi:serine acetyltransferase [Sphingobium sp. D43FB]|uniref:serine O-acetyltransferase n=1 Tax=Sphingobium sp. D43FB TaxID=2017595 RepID=UPI000BB54CDC|nr:serine acetyltransferase [Sphingobium sp. D43FB]PBN41617.1 serine acetyltransferase [Sphingobium sp. D43FB]